MERATTQKNTRKTKARKPRSKPSARQAGGASRSRPKIDQCVRDFLRALVAPWSNPPACFPGSLIALPSRKVVCFARGTLPTAADKKIYLGVRGCMVNDQSSLVHNAASDGSTAIPDFGAPGMVEVNVNSPFTSSEVTGSGVDVRLTSLGIRVRYIGSELERGGRIIMLEHPNHDSVGGKTETGLTAFRGCASVPITRDWVSLTWSPKTAKEYNYLVGTYLSSAAPIMAMIIDLPACAAGASNIEFELFMHCEATGRLVPTRTPSESNVQQTSNALATLGRYAENLGTLYDDLKSATKVAKKLLDVGEAAAVAFGTAAVMDHARRLM